MPKSLATLLTMSVLTAIAASAQKMEKILANGLSFAYVEAGSGMAFIP